MPDYSPSSVPVLQPSVPQLTSQFIKDPYKRPFEQLEESLGSNTNTQIITGVHPIPIKILMTKIKNKDFFSNNFSDYKQLWTIERFSRQITLLIPQGF